MWVRILGSAAGGGLLQWKGDGLQSTSARPGSAPAETRTQSSVAISADRDTWFLLNVSPDVLDQVRTHPELGPRPGAQRGTTIAACLLTDAEVGHTGGLPLLRERERFDVLATRAVRDRLHRASPAGAVLEASSEPEWRELPLEGALQLGSHAPSGLYVHAFEMKVGGPRHVRDSERHARGAVVGLAIIDARTGGRLVYAPKIRARTDELDAQAARADCLLADGTFWSEDEPRSFGARHGSARDLGHWPVGGPTGSLVWMARQSARHRVYVHVSDTNPMLSPSSPERRAVESHGIHVAADGDTFEV